MNLNQASGLLIFFMSITLILFAVAKLSRWTKIPDIVFFLVTGILMGPVWHWLQPSQNSLFVSTLFQLGAAIILFIGGTEIRLKVLQGIWPSIVSSATLGVIVTMLVLGFVIHCLFHMPWILAMLISSLLAPTDPATIIPVFEQIPIRERLRSMLESESAFNDATGAVLFSILLTSALSKSHFSIGLAVFQFIWQAFLGIAIGFFTSGLGRFFQFRFLRKSNDGRSGIDHTWLSLSVFLVSYLLGQWISGTGFMAVFVSGIIWSDKEVLPWRASEDRVQTTHSHLRFLSQILRAFIFVLLGSEISWSAFSRYLNVSIIIAVTLIVLARPLTVWFTISWDPLSRWQMKEQLFMMWVRETGVVPVVLSGILTEHSLYPKDWVSAVVSVVVLLTVLLQATTTSLAARKLNVLDDRRSMA